MCKISNLFEIANMDILACKVCSKMPFLGLQSTYIDKLPLHKTMKKVNIYNTPY